MKLLGNEQTAAFVLAKIREAKPARDAMLARDPFEGQDVRHVDPEMIASLRRSRARTRVTGHPIDLAMAEEGMFVLGFPEFVLGAGETKELRMPPGMPFGGRFLFVLPEIAETLEVCDVNVGRSGQLYMVAPIPVEMFSPCSMGEVHFDNAATNQPISVTLKNSASGPQIARVAMFGERATKDRYATNATEEGSVGKKIDSAERAKLYAALKKQLDTPASRSLLSHMDAIAALEAELPSPRRIPLGLVPSLTHVREGKEPTFVIEEGENGVFVGTPYVDVKVTHLILTEEAAEHFDMMDLKIGKDSQLLTSESIPLEFFSVAHNEKVLARVAEIRSEKCSEDKVIGVFARRRVDGQGPKSFNGLLWVECC